MCGLGIVAAVLRGCQTCQRLFGNYLVRKSYKLSIRSRLLDSRHFGAKNALFEKVFIGIRSVGYSVALIKTPIITYLCENLCHARKILSGQTPQ